MEDIIAPVSRELLKAELTPERRLRSTNKSNNHYLQAGYKAKKILKYAFLFGDVFFNIVQ